MAGFAVNETEMRSKAMKLTKSTCQTHHAALCFVYFTFDDVNYCEEPVMTNSLEDYLETIYLLAQANGHTRVRDVAAALHVKMPSVIKAILELKKLGFVSQEPYGTVELTDTGAAAAKQILGRHTLLKEFLHVLGVSDENAEEDACSMEHFLSAETLACITEFVRQHTCKPKKGKTTRR
jgi:DtxR family Mn-dependent transcriptional regulator